MNTDTLTAAFAAALGDMLSGLLSPPTVKRRTRTASEELLDALEEAANDSSPDLATAMRWRRDVREHLRGRGLSLSDREAAAGAAAILLLDGIRPECDLDARETELDRLREELATQEQRVDELAEEIDRRDAANCNPGELDRLREETDRLRESTVAAEQERDAHAAAADDLERRHAAARAGEALAVEIADKLREEAHSLRKDNEQKEETIVVLRQEAGDLRRRLEIRDARAKLASPEDEVIVNLHRQAHEWKRESERVSALLQAERANLAAACVARDEANDRVRIACAERDRAIAGEISALAQARETRERLERLIRKPTCCEGYDAPARP